MKIKDGALLRLEGNGREIWICDNTGRKLFRAHLLEISVESKPNDCLNAKASFILSIDESQPEPIKDKANGD